jgi:predicted DNA-binding transcriptional regulator AlpA
MKQVEILSSTTLTLQRKGATIMSELLTVKELAAYLKVPISWVYSRSRETGPNAMPRRKIGKYLRWEKKAVLEWLERKYMEDAND